MDTMQSDRQQRRAAFRVGFGTLIISVAFCLLVLVNHPDGILAFAHIGTRFSEGIPEEAGGTTGYDGQFVYFIAVHGVDAVEFIDGPTFRYQRIVYPALARLLALGIADLVPWMLVAINVASVVVSAAILAYLLAGFGASPYLALIYSIWVGNLFALRFDLTELLCYAFALGAILAYTHNRYIPAILLLVLATLTKEIGLVPASGLALHVALVRRQWGWAVPLVLAPLAAYGVWWQMMHLWLGDSPTDYPAASFETVPLNGMFSILTAERNDMEQGARTVHFIMTAVFLAVPAIVLFLAALVNSWRERLRLLTLSAERPYDDPNALLGLALLLPAVGFLFVMPGVSWQDPAAAYRVGIPIFVAGLLFVGQSYPRRLRWLVAYWLPASLIILMIPELFSGTPA